MALRWTHNSKEVADIAAKDPAALSLRLAKYFQDSSRRAEASGDHENAERRRQASDGYLDDAIAKRNSKQP